MWQAQTVFALEGVHASESNNSTLTVHMPRLISKFLKVQVNISQVFFTCNVKNI